MKVNYKHPLCIFFITFCISYLSAQEYYVNGTVTDVKNVPVIGAHVVQKGYPNTAVTDLKGDFTLKIDKDDQIIIEITSIGFVKAEINVDLQQSNKLYIQLKDDAIQLEEVIVTGVFDPRKRIESSIAITTIESKTLDRVISNSSTELLRQVPGVFVNTARGEIFNGVAVRGMVLGGNYYYVSMQEDGLPVVATQGQFSPDGFLRADLNIGRIEAVRGGTASILGVNAPGGIFNYISKTGSDTFTGEVRMRLGLEGDGKNPYYRLETGFGGPLSKKDKSWTYYIGGHYRHANGAKYPGYPLSRGGQMKGNIVKKYKNGTFQLNMKYLHDRTVQFELTPTIDFEQPRPAGNFTNSSSTLNPPLKLSFPSSILGLRSVDYDTKNLYLYKEKAIGFNWEHRLDNGWKVQNAFRYSDKSLLSNAPLIVFPYSMDKFYFYALNGLLGKFGTYNFYNPKTKQSYGTVVQELDFSNPQFPFKFTSNLNLPGSEVQPNSLLFNPLGIEDGYMKDVMNQLTIKKRWENMGITAGLLYTNTQLQDYILPPAAVGLGTIEDKPQLVGIDYVPSDVANAPTYHYTDPSGISTYGIGGVFFNKATIRQTALFFGHNWDISNKINIDWGVRYEHFYLKGYNIRSSDLVTSLGGIDGDSTTLYDNNSFLLGDQFNYENPLGTFAFSGGINYKVNDRLAFYGRYSKGSKTPDFNIFYDNSDILIVEPQRTIQVEFGLKLSEGKNNLFITPFYSALDKLQQIGRGRNIGQLATYYATPKIYNKTHAIGIEAEGTYNFDKNWSIKANLMVQQFTADKFQFYDTRQDGPADDTLIDRSNKTITSSAPPIIFNITPTYTNNKIFANFNWYFLGKRAANSSETFYLPSFSQVDLNIGYSVSPKIQIQASINNIFNTFGVMSWSGPTTSGLPFETFDFENFSPEKRKQNPDVIFYTNAIQPRSFWLSFSLKL